MRLKQLLGILLLAGVTTLATGSVSELAGVRVENHDNASVITIRANGTFTHTEYRPSDTLMLVDLGGVSIAQQDANVHPVSATGVLSYRVMGYRSASGGEVARIELNLAPGANVKVNEVQGGVELRVNGVAAAMAKSYVSSAAVDVAGKAMQLHGGIGYTWESGIHVYLKRAALNRSLFGSPADHRRELAKRYL